MFLGVLPTWAEAEVLKKNSQKQRKPCTCTSSPSTDLNMTLVSSVGQHSEDQKPASVFQSEVKRQLGEGAHPPHTQIIGGIMGGRGTEAVPGVGCSGNWLFEGN